MGLTFNRKKINNKWMDFFNEKITGLCCILYWAMWWREQCDGVSHLPDWCFVCMHFTRYLKALKLGVIPPLSINLLIQYLWELSMKIKHSTHINDTAIKIKKCKTIYKIYIIQLTKINNILYHGKDQKWQFYTMLTSLNECLNIEQFQVVSKYYWKECLDKN